MVDSNFPGGGGSSPDQTIKPETINRNVYSVFPSFAMLAGIKLEVFTALRDKPMKTAELAGALNVQEDKIRPLLYLLVVAGLLKVEDEFFSNTEEAARFLVKRLPDYLGDSSAFYQMLWELSLKTAESIRTGQPQAKLDFHNLPEDELMNYFRKQVHHSISGGKEIADKYDFSSYESLLDAGGGTGGVSISLCRKYPKLKATVADLPKVAKLAGHFIAEAGLSDRISALATDLSLETPAGTYDVAILRAVIQTLGPDQAQTTLNNVGRSLTPGGRLYIFGNVLENSRLGPPISLAYSLVFLNSYDNGQAYTEKEYGQMLATAGFEEVFVDYEGLEGMGLISARKKM